MTKSITTVYTVMQKKKYLKDEYLFFTSFLEKKP